MRDRILVTLLFLATSVGFVAPALIVGDTYAGTDILGYATPYQDDDVAQLEPGNPIQTDQLNQLPFVIEFWRGVRAGELPLWEPDVAGGVPLGTALHNRVLTPWYATFLVVPEPFALTVAVVIALFACQLTTYALARRLGLGTWASAFAGVAYTFAGPVVTMIHRVNEVLLFPALLWGVHGALTEEGPAEGRIGRRGRFVAVTALTTAATWFCGFPSVALMTFYAAGAFALTVDWRRSWIPAVGVVAGTGIASVQLLPTFEFLRATTGLERVFGLDHRLGLEKLSTSVSARFFGAYEDGDWWWPIPGMSNPAEASSAVGLVVLMLVALLAAGIVGARREPAERLLGRFFLPASLVVIGGAYVAGPFLAAIHVLPFMAENSFLRSRYILALGMVVAAATSLDRIAAWRSTAPGDRRPPTVAVRVMCGVVLALIAVGLGLGFRAAAGQGVVDAVLADLVVPLGALFVAGIAVGYLGVRRAAAVVLVVAAAVELQWGSWGFTPTSPAAIFYPRHPVFAAIEDEVGPGGLWRFMGRDTDVLALNAAAVFDLNEVRADWPVLAEYEQLVRAADPGIPDPPDQAMFSTHFSNELDLGSGALDTVSARFVASSTEREPLAAREVARSRVRPGPLPVEFAVPVPARGLRGVGVDVVPADPACVDGFVELEVGRMVVRRLLRETSGPAAFTLPDLRREEPLDAVLRSTHCPAVLRSRQVVTLAPDPNVPLEVVEVSAWTLYERPTARPRVEIAREVVRIDDPARRVAFIDGRDPDGAVVVEGADAPTGPATAELVRDGADEVEVAVTARSPTLLVLRDVDAPGWEVTIDGEPADGRRVDHAFRGVIVPAGEHTVTWRYRPRTLRVGAVLAAIGLLVAWAAAASDLRRRRFPSSARGTVDQR